jgi:hypothetical protein
MRHVDPDVLALLALGEHAGEAVDREHLADCAECRSELENLTHAATVGRSTLEAGDLLEPHPRVWNAIAEEVGAVAPVVELRPRRRWIPLAAAAAALLVVGGVGATWVALGPSPATVLASAVLDPFPDWTGSTGSAVVQERSDGRRVVEVSLEAPVTEGGFREVWLISSDTESLVSLGIVDGTSGRFTIPDGLDLARYDLVDISEEQFDGDPAHSGDSIVRGQLSGA